MEPVATATFKEIVTNSKNIPNILYIQVNKNDDVISTLEQTNKLSKNILKLLSSTTFLSLDDVQEGQSPNVNQDEALYVLCNHGYLSELASLYLEVAGFKEVYNITGGLAAFLKLEWTDFKWTELE